MSILNWMVMDNGDRSVTIGLWWGFQHYAHAGGTQFHLKGRDIMAQPTKVVKGGFRATLALFIAIIALIVAIAAYTSGGREDALKEQIKGLQTTIDKMKVESAEQLNKLRNETAGALEKMSQAVKKKDRSTGTASQSTDG